MSPGNLHTPDRLAAAARDFIVSRELIGPGDLVLAAVSGGADSMALLSILHRISGELRFRVAVAHFNHQLRETAEAELERVAAYAASIDVPFHSGTENVRAIVESTGDSVEEAARKARYRFLHRTEGEIGADRIATGHTRTDQVETVLMRIIRGTGLRGLAGIPVRRGSIVRPLLGFTREDTVSYCREARIPYVEDPSNADTRFFRNRVRLELIPLIESEYCASLEENILRISENARTVIERVRAETGPLIRAHLTQTAADRWVLETSGMTHLDDTALVVLLGDVFADELRCDMDFTRVHYEELVRLVRAPHASGSRLSLPGLAVVREYGSLIITRTAGGTHEGRPFANAMAGFPETLSRFPDTPVRLPGRTEVTGGVVTTEILERRTVGDPEILDRRAEGDPAFRATEREAYFDADRVTPPLTLRASRPGDRMQPFGMAGTKKLSDIFIDKKIPASARASCLVMSDANDILWLVGVATSEKGRVGRATREVLRVRIEKT